jgi:hypothetical protein
MTVDVVPSPNVQNQAVIGQNGDVVVFTVDRVTGAWPLFGDVV